MGWKWYSGIVDGTYASSIDTRVMNPMIRLIEKIKAHVTPASNGKEKSEGDVASARPINERDIAKVELKFGFKLPLLLRTVYLEVGNGGFGPSEGFLPIRISKAMKGMDLVAVYRERSRHPGWPPHLLPIVYSGCDVYFCVDCDHPKNRVIVFDGDLGGLDESCVSLTRRKWPYPDSPLGVCFQTRANSLKEFLEMWLTDEARIYRWD